MIGASLAVVAVGIGLFGILPMAHDFETLTLALGAFFVPVGLLSAMPATQALGSSLGFITATLLSLQGAYAADFVSYADGGLSVLLGVASAAVMTALIRSVGAEWSARRLLRAGWRELAAIPRSRLPRERSVLIGLLLDRVGLLVPRLAAAGIGNDLAAADALKDLRVGVNMVEMQRDHEALPPPVRAAVDEVLFGSATQFAVQAALGHVRPPPPSLLHQIDRALDAAIAVPGALGRHLLPQLAGIRLALFAGAEPYRLAAPTADAPLADVMPAGTLYEAGHMIGEFEVYGVFVPALLVWGLVALLLTAVLRAVLVRIGFYRLVWHRPLVDLSLLVIILAVVVAVVPHWIAP